MAEWSPNDRITVRFMIEQADHDDMTIFKDVERIINYQVYLETLPDILQPNAVDRRRAADATKISLRRTLDKLGRVGLTIRRSTTRGPGSRGIYNVSFEAMQALRKLERGWRMQEYVWHSQRRTNRK